MRDTKPVNGSQTPAPAAGNDVAGPAQLDPEPGAPADIAISALVSAYGDRLYGLGLRFCGDPHDAEDLVQEVFFQAFRAWDKFEGRSAPSTWLYTIAARVCQRRKRLRSGEPKTMASLSDLLPDPSDRVPEIPDGTDGDQLDEQLREEAVARLESAINTLPATFRLPLVLKEIGDFSISETATVLGIKPQTAKTRVHRGRLLLRKALAEVLPSRTADPPNHSRGACLDLLRMKQEALDRNAPFPLPDSELCSRCRALFDTLDLSRQVCASMRTGTMPPQLARALSERFGS